MNDRFKFRVWDKKNSEYIPDGDMCEVHCLLHRDGTLDCGISYDDGYAGGIDWVKTEDAIIEQCTGLKDKNGKLIFEGDLLGKSKNDKEFIEICWCSTLASFMYDIFPETYGNLETCHADYMAKFEIIGNIHEMEVESD